MNNGGLASTTLLGFIVLGFMVLLCVLDQPENVDLNASESVLDIIREPEPGPLDGEMVQMHFNGYGR